MLSFKVLTEGNLDTLYENICNAYSVSDREYVHDILEQLSALSEECAVSFSRGCLLVRTFDEEYIFLYPEDIDGGGDALLAVEDMREYAVREEIPFVLTEVPKETVPEVSALFSHVSLEEEDGYFTVRALSEASLMEKNPESVGERVKLDGITLEDTKEYSRLSKDELTNKYWGYNYLLDAPECDDIYFINEMESERRRGVSLSFAVRIDGRFAGEALFYYFDLKGGCECAIRLLPEYRGANYGTECLGLLFEAAREMSLLRLYATVNKKNEPSVKLFKKHFEIYEENKETVRFVKEL